MPRWNSPQHNYNLFRLQREQDMYEYTPYLRASGKGNILEIGVCAGVSTAAFLCGLEKNGGHLWSIDIDPQCADNFEHPQWTFICADSTKALEWTTGLDILFVDGDHHYETVLSDLVTYSPYVKSGGLILLHDVEPDKKNWDINTERWTDGRPEEHQYPALDPQRAMFDLLDQHPTWQWEILPGQFGLGVITMGNL
jgi:predicted O-methyltransferase YrrM